MSTFTKVALDIFAPVMANGAPRKVNNVDVQVWGAELERLIKALIAGQGGIDLPDLIYRFVITGGNQNDIVAVTNAEPPAAIGEALFTISPIYTNTGSVTINGKQCSAPLKLDRL